MEEIKYNIESGNACLIRSAVGKLVNVIKFQDLSDPKKSHELQFLLKKCCDPNPMVSLTCSQGVVLMLTNGFLDVSSTLVELYALLINASNVSGIVYCFGSLLIEEVKLNCEDIRGKPENLMFSLKHVQQPIITILKQKPEAWPHVLGFIKELLIHEDDMVQKHSIEGLYPILLHVLCGSNATHFVSFRHQLWSFLMGLLVTSSENEAYAKTIFQLLSHMKGETNINEKAYVLLEISNAAVTLKNAHLASAIAPSLALLVQQNIQTDGNPVPVIRALNMLLSITKEMANVVMVIMIELVMKCPPMYLHRVLELCTSLMDVGSCSPILSQSFCASLLPWVCDPVHLNRDAVEISSQILKQHQIKQGLIKGNSLPASSILKNQYFKKILSIDIKVKKAFELAQLADQHFSEPSAIVSWLEMVSKGSQEAIQSVFPILLGLFLHPYEDHVVHMKTLEVLLLTVKASEDSAMVVLMLLLYRLSFETDPNLNLEMVRALPVLGSKKYIVPWVLNLIESMNRVNSLKPLHVHLLTELWKTDDRCFPYLRKYLLETKDLTNNWELKVAKAAAIKEICLTRPSQHGSEMLKSLSDILNESKGESGIVPTSLAIGGIHALLKEKVFSAHSMWNVLAPNFEKEKRPFVFMSICQLLELFPESSVPQKEFVEVLKFLWKAVNHSHVAEIMNSALKALSAFQIEDFTLKMLPKDCVSDLKLPVEFCKTPMEAARKPQDVLDYIPGECWIKFLEFLPHDVSPNGVKLLASLVEKEISSLPRHMYNQKPGTRTEPPLYSYLPSKSILRALVVCIYEMAQEKPKQKANVVLDVLKVLSQEFSKPLPPLDWTLLAQIEDIGEEARQLCICTAANNCATSKSARAVSEQYLAANQEHDVYTLFCKLSALCKGIPPNVLSPFLEKHVTQSVKNALSSKEAEEKKHFFILLDSITKALKEKSIHEKNRNVLNSVLVGLCETIPLTEEEMWNKYMECVKEMSKDAIEKISSPSVWWETTTEKLEKALKIRCACALKDSESPFVWLNECIESLAPEAGDHTSSLRSMSLLFQSCRHQESINNWLLYLMDQISAVVEKRSKLNLPLSSDRRRALMFLCDIFTLAAVISSETYFLRPRLEKMIMSRDERISLLPLALTSLAGISKKQIRAFSLHLSTAEDLPEQFTAIFQQSFLCLSRDENGFDVTSDLEKFSFLVI